jgi:hypothetical protein
MAKTLKTSGDYTVKAGAGSAGSNTIRLDSAVTRVLGNLVVDGAQTIVESATLQVDDPIILLSRNNSGTDIDSGIMINRDGTGNNAALYWNEGDDVFKAVTTTSNGSGTSIIDTALVNIRVAEPADNTDAATKNYVDTAIGAIGTTSFTFVGDDSTGATLTNGETLTIAGGSNISSVVTPGVSDTITVSLNNDLTNITSVTSDASNGSLTLTANGTGEIVIDPVLTFTLGTANPTATSSTKVYNKTAGGGGTGLYFKNSNINSGTEGELISKKKATALAIALG